MRDDERLAMDPALTRRGILRVGMVTGLGLLLAGCASSNRSARLPGPRWPDPGRAPTRPAPSSWPSRDDASASRLPQPDQTPAGGVIPRSAWARGAPIPSRMDPMQPVWRITVHHDGMPPVMVRGESEVAERIEVIRVSHLERGWGDIGYHFVVDPAGRVWQGRPLTWQGAHVKDQNPGNLGVLCLGNFELQTPTPAQLAMLDRFVAAQMHRYGVPITQVRTHRELAPTICPGRNLQRYMEQTRSYGALASA